MTQRVLVLGGSGFIGRHAVAALRDTGADVVVGTRATSQGQRDHLTCRLEALTDPQEWIDIVQPFDTVLNCVGILRQVGAATYERIHHLAPAAAAQACHEAGARFIHVSALGLAETDRSRFLTSKLRGERSIMASNGDWIVVRPSLLDGDGGYGAAWLRGVAKLPMFVTPADARGHIAAVMASDVGEALARLCLAPASELNVNQSRIFELGGLQNFQFENYIRGLRRRYRTASSIGIPIPGFLARLGAHICDLMHFTPFSFGHWELLRKDNVPAPNRLPELLGRPPLAVIPAKTAAGTA